MNIIFLLQLILSIWLWKSPPSKPNSYFGYQLGSAKKSIEHWKVANQFVSLYQIAMYSSLLILSFTFELTKYEGSYLLLGSFIVAAIVMVLMTEKKLKKIDC